METTIRTSILDVPIRETFADPNRFCPGGAKLHHWTISPSQDILYTTIGECRYCHSVALLDVIPTRVTAPGAVMEEMPQ